MRICCYQTKKKRESDSFNETVRDRNERVPGIIEDLDIIKGLQIHCMCSPFHAQFNVFLYLDNICIKRSYPELFCRDSPVMPVNENYPSWSLYDNNRLSQSFLDLVHPPFEFILINL